MGPAAGCGAQGAPVTSAASAKFKSTDKVPQGTPIVLGTDYDYLIGINGTKSLTMKTRYVTEN
jgi:hypothetical protein